MQKIFEGSLAARAVSAVYAWFGSQWRKSGIVGVFLSPSGAQPGVESSIFIRAGAKTRRALCAAFQALRLDKLLQNSIFCMPGLWSALTVFLAPLIPTMATLGLVLVNAVSLILLLGRERGRRLVFSPVNRFVAVYALVYLISIFASVNFSGSLQGGLMMTVFVLYAIVIQNSAVTTRALRSVIYSLALSGALVAAYGIYQYVFRITGSAAWLDSDMFSGITTRVYSTLDNPNVLSEYLLLVIPFSIACALAVKNALAKLLFFGAAGVMLVCMLLTFARGGWLGLIVAMMIFLVMLDRRFILVGIAGLAALYFLLPDVILSRFTSIGNLSDTSTSYRLSIWLGTLAMLRDYWFVGIGPGTAAFNRIYPLYSYNAVSAPHSHNLFLQVICDSGVCGIAVFIMILFTYFRSLASAYSRETDKAARYFQAAAISAVAGFLVQSATDYSFYNYRVTLVFWAVVGIGAALARKRGAEE